ncbi:MAG: FG-GAP-like repeat-containing protein [Candidatus Krumholzibacteriia bacterium]
MRFVRHAIVAAILFAAATVQSQPYEYPYDPAVVEVMFIQESAVRLEFGGLVDLSGLDATAGVDAVVAAAGGGEWWRSCEGVPVPVVDLWAAEASFAWDEPVYNLNNIYQLHLSGGVDAGIVAAQLAVLAGVHMAYPVAIPPEPPLPSDFSPQQGYLAPAAGTPAGLDATYAWTLTGGDGSGVTVCDIEYMWNTTHQDLTKAPGSQLASNVGYPPGMAPSDHGTASIGVLVADDNGWGTTGICKGANLLTCGCYYGSPQTYNLTGAIALALAQMQAGDVILLEQQWWWSTSTNPPMYVPVEWYPVQSPNTSQGLTAVYAAIQNAVGMGVNVVEAGGNGNVNTDTLNWWGDSGAIVVGAGGSMTSGDLTRMWFSSYGARFDVQGWGEDVVTTGYTDLYSAEGANLYYTALFNGTSSASATVAGAVTCLMGWYKANVSPTPPAPLVVRATLSATGTPQVAPPTGNIGPRPDLSAAIAALTPVVPPRWVDATSGPEGDTGYGRAVTWADQDGDGDPDLYITNAQSWCRLLRNDLAAGFTDITGPVEGNQAWASEAMWGDFDNDGLPDLYVANWAAPNRLFQNMGGMFLDVGAGAANDPADGMGAQWVDADGDGRLDLYVTTLNGASNRLFRNLGNGTFLDVTTMPLGDTADAWDSAWGDYDNDGDPDCYLVRQALPNLLLRNDGNLNFVDATPGPLADIGAGAGACWGDADNDGDLDLYLCNTGGQPNRLYRNDGSGFFTDVSTPPVQLFGSNTGAAWGDYDNDGDLDLYVCDAAGANHLLRNDGGWLFSDDTNGPLGDTGVGQGCAFVDYDLDGDLDLYVVNWGSANRLFRNDIANGNNWLHVDLHGHYGNASAIGARVQAVANNQSQWREIGDEAGYCAENSPRVEFGLGTLGIVDTLRVFWPGGQVTDTLGILVNQVVNLVEPILSDAAESTVPAAFRVTGVRPNPFNPLTGIGFELPRTGHVTVTVFDAAGRRVARVAAASFPPGRHAVTWRGTDDAGRALPSGVYFARVRWDGGAGTVKMSLVR